MSLQSTVEMINQQICKYALFTNSRGDISFGETILTPIEGRLALNLLEQGVTRDFEVLGSQSAEILYRQISSSPLRLEKVLKTAIKLVRQDTESVHHPHTQVSRPAGYRLA